MPVVRLEVRAGGRATVYEVGDGGFLVGSVPGCDLRLSGAGLAPLLCLIARHAGGASLRKLAPMQAVAVNGRTVSATYLRHGDVVNVGAVEIGVALLPGAVSGAQTGAPVAGYEERERLLQEQVQQLEADRAAWFRRRDEIEAECKKQSDAIDVLNLRLRQQERELEAARSDLEAREASWHEAQQEIARQRAELESFGEEAVRNRDEAQALQGELTDIRQKLYERYRQRRDRLAVQQQAVRKAAKKVQEIKRAVDAGRAELERAAGERAAREAEIEALAAQVGRDRRQVEEQGRELAARQVALAEELSKRVEDVQARERAAAEERTALDKGQKQHQADLVRLDRIQATFEQRQKQLQAQALEVDKRFEQLQRDTRELEEQATQLDEWHNRVGTDTERLAQQKKEQEAAGKQLDQRAAALEGQQAMLAALRTRLERMREELRRQEQALSDQRVLQEAGENDLRERTEEARRLREEIDQDKVLHDAERRELDERRAHLDAAHEQLRREQEALTAGREEVRQRWEALDKVAAEQAEQAALLVARGSQLEEAHGRLLGDRQTLRDREATLAKSEQTLAALQEQLRKRSEELAERQRQQGEAEAGLREEAARFEARCKTAEQEQQQAGARLDELRRETAARAEELDRLGRQIAQREEASRTEQERLDETSRSLAGQRQALATERIGWEVEKQAAQEAARRTRDEFEAARSEAAELCRQLPDLEGRASAALDRLARAREQLREHLAEVHSYARQSRDDLESARKHVQAEVERVRQQELDLHVARDEHRLAVAAFRHQLIEWQGRVGEMKQTLLRGESRLDRRQAEVDEQAQQLAAETERLAQQAEQLEQAERLVAERRNEVGRHLSDMREWYRRKMRELSGIDTRGDGDDPPGEGDVVALPARAGGYAPPTEGDDGARADVPAAGQSILALTAEVDPGDRQLGELLRSAELIDADTLTALLLEARRQRRSLRQLLLAGNYLTLYQMALIEAGNLDGLVLGPVRVIDRLQATAHEAVYRVFDPRSNREALLRHLGEAEMHDAVRPDEFRQRFAAAAAVSHAHVAATYEVLEIHGRPAVLLEWLPGLPGGDWPALAAAPGVWFRLLSQAALGLKTVHDAGLAHGHLQPSSFVMTGDGVLKLCGLGEPHWLASPPAGGGEAIPADDLLALGHVAVGWAALAVPRRGGKAKPLPEPLQSLGQRMTAADEAARFADAASLLAELDRVSAAVPANSAAWERFVRQVREQTADLALRKTG